MVDADASRPGAPVLPCRTPLAVPIGVDVEYRIPLVPNARRFAEGHRIQLVLAGDDQDADVPAIMNFRHSSVGTSTRNTVRSSSRTISTRRASPAPMPCHVAPLPAMMR